MHGIEMSADHFWRAALAASRDWQPWRGPLAALAAALLAALLARLLRLPVLAAAAAGIGVAAGLAAVTGLGWPPAGWLARALPVAALATVIALVAARLTPARLPIACAAVALAGGWVLAGMPRGLPPLLPWIEGAGAAAVLAGAGLWLAPLGMGPVALASLSLAAGLSAAHHGHVWVETALVPAAALLGAWAAPGRILWPAAMGLAAIDVACVLAAGDLQRLSLRPLEVAAVAPLLALWLAARLASRLKLAAGAIGLVAATAVVWIVAGIR